MKKFVPLEKQSKKLRREAMRQRRGSWGEVNPVTRRSENPKVYNRKKAGQWRKDTPDDLPFSWDTSKGSPYFFFTGIQISEV